jgi:phosphatidylserine decarboxylase
MLILICLILSIIIILPLCIKCQIRLKSGILGSLWIAGISFIIVYVIDQYLTLAYFEIFILEAALIFGFLAAIVLYKFYRDPERIPPDQPNVIVAPADGKIIYIKHAGNGEIPVAKKFGQRLIKLEEFTNTDLIDDPLYVVGITLSILNVHVNRVPVQGKVLSLNYTPGRFISLRKRNAPFVNERLTTIIDQGNYKIGIVQIASHLVRRIQSYLQEGQSVDLGQRLGMIKFGSQVDLVIPRLKNLEFMIRPGDEVEAGVSIIATYDQDVTQPEKKAKTVRPARHKKKRKLKRVSRKVN